KILYVDEVGTRQDITDPSRGHCYDPDHGHPVPSHANATDRDFLQHVREAVPDHVALYGEYPCPESTAQFYDGTIHYYFNHRAPELFSPVFDRDLTADTGGLPLNLYRFIFPKMVHLDLPIGTQLSSWQNLKFTFFNGEAIYDSIWNLQESHAR